MPSSKKRTARKRKPNTKSAAKQNPPATRKDLDRLEFHRHAVALMPAESDRHPAITYAVESSQGTAAQRFCSCRASRRSNCGHLKQLSRIRHAYRSSLRHASGADAFKASFWHDFSVIMADGCRQTLETVQLKSAGSQTKAGRVVVSSNTGEQMLVYLSDGPDRSRLIERCTLSQDGSAAATRADVLQRLARLTLTADERLLQKKGLKTMRQVFEETFWYRFGYHGFREFGVDGCVLHPTIDETTGTFLLSGKDRTQRTLFFTPVPGHKVKRILNQLSHAISNAHGLALEPLALKAIYDVSLNESMDIEIRPMLRLIQKDDKSRYYAREDLARFRYGHLYYIKELGMLVEEGQPAPPPKFAGLERTVIPKSRVPYFLAEHGAALQQDLFRVDQNLKNLKIHSAFDRLEITPEAIELDWCWLSVVYGDGSQTVSLADILRAKRSGQRFLSTEAGWVDCQSAAFSPVEDVLGRTNGGESVDERKGLRLSRADIFRLGATGWQTLKVTGERQKTELLEKLLALQPVAPLPRLRGMTSSLRAYQQRGVEWLWFLYENHFGGLLCDDMGLGKTHQVMAFMVGLRETGRTHKPLLVVCPTSVISHWEQKIAQHAPGITAVVHHGGQRDLEQARKDADVIVTSYGILRQDNEALASIPFAVAVFDEIQHIKNAETIAYRAAVSLRANMKIGLTGTPIENSLVELKSLLDLTVPGYLGSNDAFEARFQIPIETNQNPSRRKELIRLIAPFTLRRLKQSVLKELPDKIEDLRTCRLSEAQVKLYRDAIASRGRQLIMALAEESTTPSYMHIFALLNLLKQICNHPALVAQDTQAYTDYASGKWDLFTEILSESLDSGQKIVVYSQYLGMIDIIKNYLTDQKVDFVRLTGASRNRGQLIERFNRDPECRVFVGSLKAGGVGIDLVAASVVIHYDRWWNAAREDQATDRVHRIGQKRGVQVFKLVTEGTLEEKIAAIIARKRDLMDSIIKEDDPALVKTFSRSELLEMLSMPDGAAEG